MASIAAAPARLGVVTDFDEAVGLGTVTDDGGASHPFHCTAIADGTRTIPVGSRVRFLLVPGRRGRREAADLVPA